MYCRKGPGIPIHLESIKLQLQVFAVRKEKFGIRIASCHRVWSILGAVRNHPKCNKQISSLPPLSTLLLLLHCNPSGPTPVRIRKTQEGLYAMRFRGKLYLSNLSG